MGLHRLIATRLLSPFLLRTSCVKLPYSRHLQTTSTFFNSEKIRPRSFTEKDVANFGDLVYKAPPQQSKIIVPVKLGAMFISFNGFALQFLMAYQGVADITVIAAMSMVLTPVSIATGYFGHWITKRYVHELYYNSKNADYTAITNNLFGFKRALTFKKSDLRPPFNHAMVCSVFVNGYPLLLFQSGYLSEAALEDFHSLEYYGMHEHSQSNKTEVIEEIKNESSTNADIKQKIARKQ